jgi:hypothetical protein
VAGGAVGPRSLRISIGFTGACFALAHIGGEDDAVLDLDRAHEGLIKISQTPILHLSRILDRDAEAKP